MNEKELIRVFYEDIISNTKLEEIAKFVADDSIVRIGNQVYPLDVDGMREHLIATKKTYPDYSMNIIKQYQDGDYILSEFILTGTNEGE